MSTLFILNILLAIIWAIVTGHFTFINTLFGFILSSGALWLIREQFDTTQYFTRGFRILALITLFLKELIISSLRVTAIVLAPKLNIKTGFIAYELNTDRDIEITLLANLITLTPGTLSVDVTEDRKILYIHTIDATDPEKLKDDIKNGFEKKIMEALR